MLSLNGIRGNKMTEKRNKFVVEANNQCLTAREQSPLQIRFMDIFQFKIQQQHRYYYIMLFPFCIVFLYTWQIEAI